MGLGVLEIEAQRAACPTRLGASDWEQLLAFWRLCQPAAATRGFLLRARLELERRQARPRLASDTLEPLRVGRRYGPRFRAFAFRLLEMEPRQRVAAKSLSTSCQQTFRLWVALPSLWLLDCYSKSEKRGGWGGDDELGEEVGQGFRGESMGDVRS